MLFNYQRDMLLVASLDHIQRVSAGIIEALEAAIVVEGSSNWRFDLCA